MNILAIETSCDDTCISIIQVKNKKSKILSNIISSQVKLHTKYGGVYPTLAKREHQRNLPLILKKVLKKTSQSKIDLIAITVGPGLEPCLWTGINFAKEISKKWNLSIVPVNHIEGHIAANFIGGNSKFKITNYKNLFPAICLIVSGGHTQLILMQDIGKYKILGETRDDAAGECFDKTARILGLSYPGGPAIAAEAAKYKIQDTKYKIQLPRPMMYQKHKRGVSRAKGERRVQSTLRPNYDFSFSGLKTAVLYEVRKKKRKSKKFISAMAFEIQQAIIDVLIHKTLKAAKEFKVRTIILGGGVIANNELRKQFKSKVAEDGLRQVLFPSKRLCVDNAAMIGITAYFNLKKKTKNFENIKADANLRINKA